MPDPVPEAQTPTLETLTRIAASVAAVLVTLGHNARATLDQLGADLREQAKALEASDPASAIALGALASHLEEVSEALGPLWCTSSSAYESAVAVATPPRQREVVEMTALLLRGGR